MTDSTIAVFDDYPIGYQLSSRKIWDILSGEDSAYPLLEASCTADTKALQDMLAQPEWIGIALQDQLCIEREYTRERDKNNMRPVAMKMMLNIERMTHFAALFDKSDNVSILLQFSTQQGLPLSSVINRFTVDCPLKLGHVAVLEVLAEADPTIVEFKISHHDRALDWAVKRGKTETVAMLLKHGADPGPDPEHIGKECYLVRSRGYRSSLLSLAAKAEGARMTELLLEHGVTIAQSGALQYAAELGNLDAMHVLIQCGAGVDEQLTKDKAPQVDNHLKASWTPMHFAASEGKLDAIELLKANGARTNVRDINGKTPAEFLERARDMPQGGG